MTETSVMMTYSNHRGALQRCIDEIIDLDRVPGAALKELREKLKSEVFPLLVVGQFKRGRTGLVKGGKHADNNVDIQEFMIAPVRTPGEVQSTSQDRGGTG